MTTLTSTPDRDPDPNLFLAVAAFERVLMAQARLRRLQQDLGLATQLIPQEDLPWYVKETQRLREYYDQRI